MGAAPGLISLEKFPIIITNKVSLLDQNDYSQMDHGRITINPCQVL